MSLLDFFTGNWTFTELVREIGPLALATVSAYLAGYWRGRNVEVAEVEDLYAYFKKRIKQEPVNESLTTEGRE